MFFLCRALLVTYALGQQYWDIQTSFGPIRGQAVKTTRNQIGYAFLGVPFAAPPVEYLRFKKPVNPKIWNKTLNVLSYKPGCLQLKSILSSAASFSEDCLYLNVFSSRSCLEKGNCPILFHVHGGMRNYCSAADIPPEGIVKNLANEERNIVVVTVQYRLGVLGWLNLHDEQNGEHSNIGLRDVLHALNWTNKEISHFGGDPTRLTLMGLSSGAEMVNEIVMPGVSNGLFHQIILMSAPHFGGRHKRVNRRFSEKLTTRIGCGQPKSKTELELSLACLRAKSEQEYLNTLTSFDVEVDEVFGTWIDGPDGVFPESIEEQLQRKMPNITALIGTTASEFPDTLYLDAHQNVRTDILDDVCVHIAYENYENPERFRHICNKFYNNASRILSLNDDYLYYESSSMFANKYSRSGKVFVYSYANPIPGMPIPLHATDANNILGQNYFAAEELSEADEKRQQIHSGMFANFIRSGNPSYEDILWTSWEPERRNYMVIDFDANGNIKGGMADGYHSDYHKFIKETVPREAGARLPEQSLPPEIDFFSQISMIYSIENFWKIEYPLLLGKTSVALRKMKALWTGHVRELRTLSAVPLSQSDQFTVIIAVFLSIIMGYVLLKTYYDWRKRKNYIVLDGHNKC